MWAPRNLRISAASPNHRTTPPFPFLDIYFCVDGQQCTRNYRLLPASSCRVPWNSHAFSYLRPFLVPESSRSVDSGRYLRYAPNGIDMLTNVFVQAFRWAKVWGICGAIAIVGVGMAHPGRMLRGESVPGADVIIGSVVGGIVGAAFGAMAGAAYGFATTMDAAAGSKIPLGLIAGGLGGFFSMKIVHFDALSRSQQQAPWVASIVGAVLGFSLASTGRHERPGRP